MVNLTDEALAYCEEHGIYEVYKQRGNVITYYSFFGKEGFLKVTKNIKTGKETREDLRYKEVPKFLISENGGVLYNYFTG